jgi:CheY-like chemotaxis protein
MQERSLPSTEGASERPAVAVVALVADLIFASRIRGTAQAAGVQAITVRSAAELLQRAGELQPSLILVDLDARAADPPTAIARLKEDPQTRDIPILAFGSHVQREAIEAARAAGADRVLARSAFVRELPFLLRRLDGPAADAE